MKKSIILFVAVGLLVVIVGVFFSFSIANQKAVKMAQERDTARISDLDLLKNVIETYKQNQGGGSYPVEYSGGRCIENWSEMQSILAVYYGDASKAPVDPLYTAKEACYWYISDEQGTRFKLLARMEVSSDKALNDGGDQPVYYEVFSSTTGSASLVLNQGWVDGVFPLQSAWKARRAIVVNNPTQKQGTDYQVKVVVEYTPLMKSDFSDVVFTDSNQNQLNYYLFPSDLFENQKGTFWVKLSSLAPRDNKIFLYYGNQNYSVPPSDTIFSPDNIFVLSQKSLVLNPVISADKGGDSTLVFEENFDQDSTFVVSNNPALLLNGDSSYLEVDSSSSLDGTGSFSVGGWFYPEKSVGHEQALVWKQYSVNDVNTGYSIVLNSNGTVSAYIYTSQGLFSTTSQAKLTNASWNFVGLVYDNINNKFQIYLNGIASGALAQASGNVTINSYPLRVGFGTSENYFFGKVDEIAIFMRALSDDEMLKLSQKVLTNFSSLSLYLPFSEGKGETTVDASSKNNAVSLIGFTALDFPEEVNGKASTQKVDGWVTSGPIFYAKRDFASRIDDEIGNVSTNRSVMIQKGNQVELNFYGHDTKALEVSVLPLSSTAQQVFSFKANQNADRLNLSYQNSKFSFFVLASDKETATITTTKSYAAGIWHDIVLQLIFISYQKWNVAVFVDGAFDSLTQMPTWFSSSLLNVYNSKMVFGDNEISQFVGGVDEVRFYSRTLSDQEILAHFAKRSSLCAGEMTSCDDINLNIASY